MIDVANYVSQNLGPVDLASLLTTGNRVQDAQQNTLLNKLKLQAAQEQMQRQAALPQILANIVGSKGTPGTMVPQEGAMGESYPSQVQGGTPGTGLLGGQISPQEAMLKMASSDPTLLPHAFSALATMYKPTIPKQYEPTPLEKHIAAREALPENSPLRAIYDKAIKNETERLGYKNGSNSVFLQKKNILDDQLNQGLISPEEYQKEMSILVGVAAKPGNPLKDTASIRREQDRYIKPIDDVQLQITKAKQLLATDSPAGDIQVRQLLTDMFDRTRATNLLFKSNANFGTLAGKAAGFISGVFTGQYTNEQRKQIYEMIDQMEKNVVAPSRKKISSHYADLLKKSGYDPAYSTTPDFYGSTGSADPNAEADAFLKGLK